MRYQVQSVKWLPREELVNKLKENASAYSKYADSTLLFVFRHSKSDNYDFYEARFGKENFMHLVGIKSETKKAVEFYEACIKGTIGKEDCKPRHSSNNMYAKIMIMKALLDFANSKCYKIGNKDLVTKDNDFEMATGNNEGIIGYDRRVAVKGSRYVDLEKASMPTTLLTNPLKSYCSKPQKIMFVLKKMDDEKKYTKCIYEIKKGLLEAEMKSFPDYILRDLDMSLGD